MNAVIDEILSVKLFSEFKSSTAENFIECLPRDCFVLFLQGRAEELTCTQQYGQVNFCCNSACFLNWVHLFLPFVLVRSNCYLSSSMSFIEIAKSFRSFA